MHDDTLAEIGVPARVIDQVTRLATLAGQAGLDGVVASPQETEAVRRCCGDRFTIVTPGIRGGAAASDRNDQERTMTAGEAIAAGASYVVVGRPVIGAPDPREAAERIAGEILAATSR
jgi:orotidine-5'-phosphate decarboxylase